MLMKMHSLETYLFKKRILNRYNVVMLKKKNRFSRNFKIQSLIKLHYTTIMSKLNFLFEQVFILAILFQCQYIIHCLVYPELL